MGGSANSERRDRLEARGEMGRERGEDEWWLERKEHRRGMTSGKEREKEDGKEKDR